MVDAPNQVYIISKDDLTAGDGDKQEIITGKAELANRTTCNSFNLLRACGIPVAFESQIVNQPADVPDWTMHGFIAPKCKMVDLEVVVRREADGSFLERFPHIVKRERFPRLRVEFFAKTKDRKWRGKDIPMDDPLIVVTETNVEFYLPHFTKAQRKLRDSDGTVNFLIGQKPFMTVSKEEFFGDSGIEAMMPEMEKIARRTFLILEKAWQLLRKTMGDFKVEFGIDPDGRLRLADVLDNDSWRLRDAAGNYICKQLFRNDGAMNTVTANFRLVADLTGQFSIPSQSLILWRGSEKDDISPLTKSVDELVGGSLVTAIEVTCSMHKQSVRGLQILSETVQKHPDAVIIDFIGMSNGAGPTLSANTSVPVINVPADFKGFPDDIWSSLRLPSGVPAMTVLSPANAVLAALQILGMRNPGIYAALQYAQEERLACN